MLSDETRELLELVIARLTRYLVVTPHQRDVLALWTLHTWAFRVAETTPYLLIGSPERESGKTRLLEFLVHYVACPWLTGRVTAAVLMRKIHRDRPTFLLDESDSAFKSSDYAEAVIGLLNTGYRVGGQASVCVRRGGEIDFEDFSTFSPKAIAGIGAALPDTVRSRGLPIEMRRRAIGEQVARLRWRDAALEAEPVRSRLETWAEGALSHLQDARPQIPDVLGDRTADCVEPLLAIADLAGEDWPDRARSAVVVLTTSVSADDESTTVLLLSDIRQVFDRHAATRLATTTIVQELNAIEESPWGEWRNGRPLSAHSLAALLRRHRIRPGTVRLDDLRTAKGYKIEDFEDAWARYVPSAPSLASQDLGLEAGCDGVTVRTGD